MTARMRLIQALPTIRLNQAVIHCIPDQGRCIPAAYFADQGFSVSFYSPFARECFINYLLDGKAIGH